MQIATITILVESTGAEFLEDQSDIYEKASAKLQTGQFTADITEKAD